jgi:hypothetical protein
VDTPKSQGVSRLEIRSPYETFRISPQPLLYGFPKHWHSSGKKRDIKDIQELKKGASTLRDDRRIVETHQISNTHTYIYVCILIYTVLTYYINDSLTVKHTTNYI